MLQDFLSNRPGIQTSDAPEAQPRNAGFQPYFTARAATLPGQTASAEAELNEKRLEEPEIELIEEAGQVRRIIVTCKCCEKITIDCEY